MKDYPHLKENIRPLSQDKSLRTFKTVSLINAESTAVFRASPPGHEGKVVPHRSATTGFLYLLRTISEKRTVSSANQPVILSQQVRYGFSCFCGLR
jgi:hypothetical protein